MENASAVATAAAPTTASIPQGIIVDDRLRIELHDMATINAWLRDHTGCMVLGIYPVPVTMTVGVGPHDGLDTVPSLFIVYRVPEKE